MKKIQFLCLLILMAACSKKPAENDFNLLKEISVIENGFTERVFKNDLYQIIERAEIPEYVDKIYQLRYNPDGIYFNDSRSIYKYKDGSFENIFTPSKGSGPNEVPQIFRFDIMDDDIIAIAGYPDLRILLHQLQSDTSKLIMTEYRGNVLIDKKLNFYGEDASHSSSYMVAKFNSNRDSISSFGNYFNNQERSLDMFDSYWDYNQKHDLIVIGFMYAGFSIVSDTNGKVRYVIESFKNAGNIPAMVQTDNYRYVDGGDNPNLSGLSTFEDEVHIYSANAANRDQEIYGAVIDVFDIQDGQYKFSYILKEKLHWPILLMDDYKMASVTEDYNLVIWSR